MFWISLPFLSVAVVFGLIMAAARQRGDMRRTRACFVLFLASLTVFNVLLLWR